MLSILFVLWFFTGFVMIYHNFPKMKDSEKYRGLAIFSPDSQHHVDTLLKKTPTAQLDYLSLKSDLKGKFQLIFSTAQRQHVINEHGITSDRYSFKEIKSYASRVNTAPINKVDTLNSLDRWLTYDKYKDDFPVYKFHFTDKHHSELYVSSLTGEGLQYTNSNSRFWAWVGAIPHWLYIANLRHYTNTWKTTVIVLSGIGSVMCISGLTIALIAFYRQFKHRRQILSPYKKVMYKWHHITGFFFGFFVFTFAFSGMMSLQKVPQWLIKTSNQSIETALRLNPVLPIASYRLDYKLILKKHAGHIKKLEWTSFGKKPYYKAIIDDSTHYVDATLDSLKELSLTPKDIKERIALLQTEPVKVQQINKYDNYYIHKKDKLPLPVYKVTVSDADSTVYYINPKTAETRYFNSNLKIRKWTYQALHSFTVKQILDKPVLWNFLMWSSMLGGTVVSLTGFWLSIRFIKRKINGKQRY